jgi:F-type H+-transporting ATPase subunit gamma
MASRKDVKSRIASVKNIHKITRAMEMVAAARLRRAEQRIQALRPYADAIRRLTRQAAQAAEYMPRVPILAEREQVRRAGILVVSGDRGLAGAFNSNVLRAGMQANAEFGREGIEVSWYAVGRRGVSSLNFRKLEPTSQYVGITDRPSYADARDIAQDLVSAYVDEKLDRVDIIYNAYQSALSQRVTREVLLPVREADVVSEREGSADDDQAKRGEQDDVAEAHDNALWIYEPDPEEILQRLLPDFVEITVFRALLESTASEHGARMTAMRNASENADQMIDDLTLEANRVRQAEITQEIMEVVAGAEALG